MGRVATAWDQSLLPQGARRVTGPTSSRGRTPNDATALPPIGSRAGTMEGDERGSRASRWSLLGGARVAAPARRGPDRTPPKRLHRLALLPLSSPSIVP